MCEKKALQFIEDFYTNMNEANLKLSDGPVKTK